MYQINMGPVGNLPSARPVIGYSAGCSRVFANTGRTRPLSCIALGGGVKAGGASWGIPLSIIAPPRRPLDFNTKAPRKGHGRAIGERPGQPVGTAAGRGVCRQATHRLRASGDAVTDPVSLPLAISMGMGKA